MATSPYFSTSNPYIEYDIHVDTLSQDIANNKSRIKVWVIAWRTNQGYQTYGSGYCIVNINGTEYYDTISSSQVISYNSDTLMFERTVDITHDADGKKTIYVSAYFDHQRFSSSSQGFNVTLTDIPRQANILSAPNFYDVDNPTITYSNPAGAVVTSLQACISLDNSTASVAYRDIPKTGSSYTFSLTQAERNTLLAATPNSNNKAVYFIVKTVIAGVTYYSRLQRTMTVKNANPTITGASYQDVNGTTTAITGDNTKIIQNNSNVTFKFTSLAALKYATLTSVAVTIDGVTKTASLSGSTASNVSLSFGTINSSSNVTANIALTDSRGNVTRSTLTVTMLEWSLPTATISLARKSNYYSETTLKVTANYASLNSHNTITITYQYKEKSSSTWSSAVTIQDGVATTITLDNTKSYDFKINVSDRIGSTTYNKALQIGIPILYIDRMLRSVGIGTLPDEYNMIAVDRRLQLKNTEQEKVADLWATVTTDPLRSAFLSFKSKDAVEVMRLTGYNGGQLTLKNISGNSRVYLGYDTTYNGGYIGVYDASGTRIGCWYTSSYGGSYMGLYNSNGDVRLSLANHQYGGRLWIGNSSGNGAVIALAAQAGDGTVNVYDGNGNNTINLSGLNGIVNCKKVKASEGVVELYNGSLSSGSTTFNYGEYNLYIVSAHVHSGGSTITMTIPKAMLTGSDVNYCISDEVDYIVFKLRYSGSTATLTIGNMSSDGWVDKVYGVN